MAGRTFPFAVRAVASLLCAALVDACSGATPPPPPTPPPVRVTINRVPHELPPGTTFGDVVDDLRLHATNGRLLSVSGAILNRYEEPGRLLLNGSSGFPSTGLADGDVVRVVNGRDETEALRRVVADLGQRVGNPERTLDTYPTKRIVVSGRMSGEVVSITDVSKGPGMAPHAVALTFDDGPWPSDTERVLAVLERYHVPATFFMIGYLAKRYPDLVRKVRRAGFQIGNHSFDHPESPSLADLTQARITSELADVNTVLRHQGIRPTLFRPPGGSYDDFVTQEARRQGMRLVLWSVDPQDWQASRTAKQVARSVLQQIRPGSIVLLHDGGGDAGHTIRALPRIIRGIRERGLRLVLVPATP